MTKKFPQQECVLNLITSYLKNPRKAPEVMSDGSFENSKELSHHARSYANAVFLAYLRNKTAIEITLQKLATRPPKNKLHIAAICAFADILSAESDKYSRISDSWVEYVKSVFSKGEANFLNAILRKFLSTFQNLRENAKDAQSISQAYSMPEWLVERRINQFGIEKCIEILKIENTPSEVFFRKSPSSSADALYTKNEQYFETSKFPNFFKVKSGTWNKVSSLLETPYFYAQDPSTSYAPKMLSPIPEGTYLDLCAAPGGKSRLIADILLAEASSQKRQYTREQLKHSLLVSVDKGIKRVKTLLENMMKADFINSAVIDCDILENNLLEILAQKNLPSQYDGVFIDAPCSNTGVLRRRPDARWRLNESDISNCAKIQLSLLNIASKFVRSGGKLVYSTCSIDFEENEKNAETFIKENPDFTLIQGRTFLPTFESDGAGAFCFQKK